jgi:hypothetical protein
MVRTTKHPAKALVERRPVESLIHVIRRQKVMLDRDLAELYGVPTKRLNEAVKRNPERFPAKFMFKLSVEEANSMRSQIATASKINIRFQPLAFTEHGVVMLSAVLNSARAVEMSILVVDAFVRMRELVAHNRDIAIRIEKLERSHDRSASVIEILVEDIDRLAHDVKEMKALPPVTKRKIKFHLGDDE